MDDPIKLKISDFKNIISLINRFFHDVIYYLPPFGGYDLLQGHPNRHHHASTVIGVLDIYGFEVFDNNSFEQVTRYKL